MKTIRARAHDIGCVPVGRRDDVGCTVGLMAARLITTDHLIADHPIERYLFGTFSLTLGADEMAMHHHRPHRAGTLETRSGR